MAFAILLLIAAAGTAWAARTHPGLKPVAVVLLLAGGGIWGARLVRGPQSPYMAVKAAQLDVLGERLADRVDEVAAENQGPVIVLVAVQPGPGSQEDHERVMRALRSRLRPREVVVEDLAARAPGGWRMLAEESVLPRAVIEPALRGHGDAAAVLSLAGLPDPAALRAFGGPVVVYNPGGLEIVRPYLETGVIRTAVAPRPIPPDPDTFPALRRDPGAMFQAWYVEERAETAPAPRGRP